MIRKAQQKDIARINELLHQVLEVHALKRPDIFKPGSKKYTDEQLLEIMANVLTPIFVYTNEDDVVLGYCFCIVQETINSNNLRDRKTLYIDDLCVDQNYRRRHIGQQLFSYVKTYAKTIKCDSITLNVWQLNQEAMAFYQKMSMKTLKTVMEAVL